jgi:hypothetical protein
VAVQATRTESLKVVDSKYPIDVQMAIDAALLIETRQVLPVTILAIETITTVSNMGVGGQSKSHRLVGEGSQIHMCQGCGGSQVLGVALPALQSLIPGSQRPVQTTRPAQLFGDPGMANKAAIRHAIRPPKCRVAGRAAPTYVPMSADTTYGGGSGPGA